MIKYTTFHIQKDKRITLGTAVHKFTDCPYIKGRELFTISGQIASKIPKCRWCFWR